MKGLLFIFLWMVGSAPNGVYAGPIAMPGFPFPEPLSASVASLSLGQGKNCLDSAKRARTPIFVGRPKLEYRYRLQKGRAPLMVILPGLGSDWDSSATRGVAQMYWEAGFSLLVIPNPMHRYFILSASTVGAAGYTPSDAQDVIHVLNVILSRIQEKYPHRLVSTLLTGISLGGLDALAVAAKIKTGSGGGLHFDRVIALHPGVDLLETMRILDGYYVLPASWVPSERSKRVADALDQIFASVNDGDALHLSVDEMKFLVGLDFHESLSDAMLSSWEQMDWLHVSPVSRDRSIYVDQAERILFSEYALHTLFPAVKKRTGRDDYTFDQMISDSALDAFIGDLIGDPKVRVFSSADDIILGERAQATLRRFPESQLRGYEHGGHLGSLLYPAVRADIVRAARQED